MIHPYLAYAVLQQREQDLAREAERERLRALATRLRPGLREQLGGALVRLGARVAGSRPALQRPTSYPDVPCLPTG